MLSVSLMKSQTQARAFTSLHLYKQNLKFSAAHFLIFDEKRAERLHGHNYQVRVVFHFGSQTENENGYLIDFQKLKSHIKNQLDQWDEMVLLPGQNQEMKFVEKGPSLEVRFRDRFYVFPKNEVLRLPITNTSVEQLSRLLAENFYEAFSAQGVKQVRVLIEETRGQGASSLVGSSS